MITEPKVIDGVLFSPMPRGTLRGRMDYLEIDCWQVGGHGWRYTLWDASFREGIDCESGFKTFEACAQAGVVRAREWIHPLVRETIAQLEKDL